MEAKKMKPSSDDGLPFTEYSNLKDFGYSFNSEGVLRKLNPDGSLSDNGFEFNVKPEDPSYNQEHYEALGKIMDEEVYRLLEDRGGLSKVELNPSGEESDPKSFVFCSPGYEASEQLLLLVHGAGVVKAGQWARRLIINNDLDKGTQLPYIKWGLDQEMGVVVFNTNYNEVDGEPIVGSERPERHAATVWREIVSKCSKVKSILIVAHSYGGIVTMDLAKRFQQDFLTKVKGIYFTDSVHRDLTGKPEVDRRLEEISVNYVTSDLPLGEEIESASKGRVRSVSAGHVKHEWTSWSAMTKIFAQMKAVLEGQKEEAGSRSDEKASNPVKSDL